MEANAFELLSLSPRLTVSDEELREAFREAGKSAHPDAGGDEAGFEALRSARDLLASPSKRLRHWLALRGIEVDTRGVVDTELMDVFGMVGGVTQKATECARKRGAAKSALGLALLENETQQCIEEVETAIAQVDAAIAREIGSFAEIESGQIDDPEELARTVRNLMFLEKWRHTLRGLMPQLV